MTSLKTSLLFTCLTTLLSCTANPESHQSPELPKNLSDAILYFQKNWTKWDQYQFKSKSEEDAVADLHLSTGTWIRNNWVHGSRDTALTNYFHSLGINHPDDISSIILTSLHRTLNKKDIQLKKQLELYKKFWLQISECEEKQRAEAVSNYKKFNAGNNVIIRMPIDTTYGNSNAGRYMCPNVEWTFDKAKDLILKGEITEKHYINSATNVFFKVKITFMNRKGIEIEGTKAKVGDAMDLSLVGLRIE